MRLATGRQWDQCEVMRDTMMVCGFPNRSITSLPRHAKRAAGYPHHRPLELSRGYEEDDVRGRIALRSGREAAWLTENPLALRTSRTCLSTAPAAAEAAAGEDTGCIYAFPSVAFAPGAIKAIASRGGKTIAEHELQTAGEPKAIKLTVHTAPNGFRANGSDVVRLILR